MNRRRKRTYASKYEEDKKYVTGKKARKMRDVSLRVTRPLGRTQKVYHRYVETALDLDPSIGGVPAEYFFSANGLYDPNVTGAGHQPIGFDQMSGFFDHYTVIYSECKVWGSNLEPQTGRSQVLGIKLDDNTTPIGDLANIIENGGAVWTVLGPSASGAGNNLITMSCNPNKFLGRPKPMCEDDLKGDSGSNPDEQAYFHIFAAPNAIADTAAVRILVEITYVAIWSEPRDLAQS